MPPVIVAVLLSLAPAPSASAQVAAAPAQAIQHVLDDSVAAWNAGDLERFAAVYSDAPASIFSGARDVLHRARSVAIAANRAYFTPEHRGERGRLRYETIEINPIDATHYVGLVRFDLAGAGSSHGHYTGVSVMLFALEEGRWMIVLQHDSNDSPPE